MKVFQIVLKIIKGIITLGGILPYFRPLLNLLKRLKEIIISRRRKPNI